MATLHGMYGTSFYTRWTAMKTRCTNPKHPMYHRYGGRGISFDPRWQDFKEFFLDMYEPYKEHVAQHGALNTNLDRINNNGPYTKTNCRWTTRLMNSRNNDSVRLITMDGRTQCITAWAKELGMNKQTLHERLKRGWPIRRALSRPVNTPVRT